jgi:hypothetical protein
MALLNELPYTIGLNGVSFELPLNNCEGGI